MCLHILDTITALQTRFYELIETNVSTIGESMSRIVTLTVWTLYPQTSAELLVIIY